MYIGQEEVQLAHLDPGAERDRDSKRLSPFALLQKKTKGTDSTAKEGAGGGNGIATAGDKFSRGD